ncbi:unnamed protein product [Schistosoma spindalis]|nr:unnamed protein product [Schistosoma spindale]
MFRINKLVAFTCITLLICLILLVNSTLSMRTNNDLMDLPESYSPEYELHIYDHIEYRFIKILLRKKIVKLINHFILIMVKDFMFYQICVMNSNHQFTLNIEKK